MKFSSILFMCLLFSVIMTSCVDDPVVENEEEVITTLTYTLSPSGGGSDVVLQFQDLDGDGGNAPTVTGGTLAANTSYTGSLELLNEAESPAEDITEEIAEEDAEHQFFFSSTIPGIVVAYGDTDDDGNPVGLSTTITTSNAGSGSLTVILRHEPDKSASGVSDGDITNAGGETDIEVSFSINVE